MQRVFVTNAHPRYRIRRTPVEGYVRRVLGTRTAWISVVFIDSPRCRAINRKFLQHDFATDVIAFALETGVVLEGEIYVNLDRARQQAREVRVSMAEEIARLVIHGALHLLGYDDRTARQARRMKEAQERQVRYWFPNTQTNNGT